MNILNGFFFVLHRFLMFVIHFSIIIRRWWRRSSDTLPLETLLQLKDENHFSRLPKHLAFINNSEDTLSITNENLAKFVSWSIQLQIPFLSLYEPNGLYKNSQHALANLVEHELLQQGVPENELECKINVKENECVFTVQGNETRVKFLSIEDGRPQLAEVVKQLVKERVLAHNNNLTTENVETHPSEITKLLKEKWNYPEPDFAIVCSILYSVHGYPPWQLRYTEVSLLNHPDDVTVQSFYHQFCRFAKIEQRFGA